MPSRNVISRQAALKVAGDRRRQLDRERGEQDKRIEAATAETLVALQLCDDAERALVAAQREVGESLRQILVEDVSVARAAALLDLDTTEIRRLLKAAPVHDQGNGTQEDPLAAVPRDEHDNDGRAQAG